MFKSPNKRRTYIVDPEFQYRLIRKISVIAILIIVMSLSFLVIVHQLYGDIEIKIAQPDPFEISGIVTTLPEQASLLRLLWPVMLICVFVTLSLTFVFGVIISHRMAGPVYRIRKTLGEMAQGNLSGQIQLRKKDEFKSLCQDINNLKTQWGLKIKELREICQELENGDEKIEKKHLSRLNKILSTFKIE